MYRAMLVFPAAVDLVNGSDRIGRMLFVECIGRSGYKLLVQQHITQFVIIGKAKSLYEFCVYGRCAVPRVLDAKRKRLRARLIRVPSFKALSFRRGWRRRFRQILPFFDCQQLIKLFPCIEPEDPAVSRIRVSSNIGKDHAQ